MNKIIICTGDLASGKLTFAKAFKDKYNYLLFSKDKYKEMLVDFLGFKNREENKKISNLTMEVILFSISSAMEIGTDIIVEANFREVEMVRLFELVRKFGYDYRWFCFRGDISILYKNFLARLPSRHPAHNSLNLGEDIKTFESYILSLRQEKIPFDYTIIDISNNSPEQVFDKLTSNYI